MSRIALSLDEQVLLLKRVQSELGLSQQRLAQLSKAHPRTVSDWIRGKYRMRYECLQQLIEQTQLELERPIGQIPEFTHIREAARLGGLRRALLYGNPGTPEGRRRGGSTAIARRLAGSLRADSFCVAKKIYHPNPSSSLAEFVGMMLGDGCLSGVFQAVLYFNTETDLAYARHMEALGLQLFGIRPTRVMDHSVHGGALIYSSKRLVDCLTGLGLTRGDKVVSQAQVPSWILERMEYRTACLRGLMDTDGSLYIYRHTVSRRQYSHAAWCFTNRSQPLLQFVKQTLQLTRFNPTTASFKVYLYRADEVERYFCEIGSHNPKYLERFETLGRGSGVVERAALEKR